MLLSFEVLRKYEKSVFFIETSYHLPFSPIMKFAMSYEYSGGNVVKIDNVIGSYLTLDFRYFFNEKPDPSNN